jgi:hypothetical protein
MSDRLSSSTMPHCRMTGHGLPHATAGIGQLCRRLKEFLNDP